MSKQSSDTSARKKDHISLCVNDDVGFSQKTAGFEHYDFEHYALTEVEFEKIDYTTNFLNQKIRFPFLISCMTGGTSEAERINEQLALAASELNIPIGVGSQRQALENKKYHASFDVIKRNAKSVPILSNIGAAQVAQINDVKQFEEIIQLVNASALVIHVNPLQELIQNNGEPNFSGLLNQIEKLVKYLEVPVIVKEVGSGISKRVAKKLLDVGVEGIDVAGAGGTSWSQVELLRNQDQNEYFRNWGLPTTYCLRKIRKLKKKYNFTLIASGGITNGADIAKSIALGADLAASAQSILQAIMNHGVDGAVNKIKAWFDDVRKIMYLTGSHNIEDLKTTKLIYRSKLH